MQFVVKVLISALVIAIVSEMAKRFTLAASILASMPLVSLLAIVWLYMDTKDIQKVINLTQGIFFALVPTLLFFIVFPLMLKSGMRFGIAIILSLLVLIFGYAAYVMILCRLGIKI